jgi:hypothetical protein
MYVSMQNNEIPHFVLRTPFGMTVKTIVISNKPSGEVRDLTDASTKTMNDIEFDLSGDF